LIPLSAVLITLDEERNLPAALESLAFCDQIVIVDAGSKDRTRELAVASGARVLLNTPWPGFVEQRNRAVAEARHDWVLCVDADERVTPELRREIDSLRATSFGHDGYRMPRAAHYLGRWIRGTDWYPDRQLRLFNRDRGHWEGGSVHESVRVDGAVGVLRGELEHHPFRDISDHLDTIDRYTTLWASQAAAEGRTSGIWRAALTPGWTFFRNYVLRGGIALGGPGLIVSVMNSYYSFLKFAKLRELTQSTTT
jgi:glycosyltransferase involved in cell wall biosynthesis